MATNTSQSVTKCEDCLPTHVQPASEKTMAHSPAAETSDGLSGPDSKKIHEGEQNGQPPPLSAPEPTAPSASVPAEGEISPPKPVKPSLVIEFCDRCRWAPRATWIQTELFLTFPSPLIRSITLIPLNAPETGGRFRVWLDLGDGDKLVWDRKTEGGFPELKVLKQRIRNHVQPDLSLGHSDGHTQGKA